MDGEEYQEIYPEYYGHDDEGPKPVYQVNSIGRGQAMNNFGRRPSLQCYGCKGPHKYSKCSDRPPLLCYRCNDPQKITDCPYQQNNVPSTSTPSAPKRYCARCGIYHLYLQCPHQPQEAPVITPLNMLSPLAEDKYHPSLIINAITRLQAKTDAVLEASDAKDPRTDTKAKLKAKKIKSKKFSKTIVGTPIDPVTMQNASDDSDDPSSSESLAESQRVTRSKVPQTHHQLSVDKPGTYPKPEQEIQRVQEAI